VKISKWATTVALGVAGALVMAGPAAATYDVAKVDIIDDCTDVVVKIDGDGTNRGWRVLVDGEVALPEGAELGDIPQSNPPWGLWIDPQSAAMILTLEGASGSDVEVQWYRSSVSAWGAHEKDTKYDVYKEEVCPTPTPTPTPSTPATEPPAEDNGEGGELPETGTSTTLIIAGAFALLAVGGGLFAIARRRRITFSA
jgi:LPXTG-motif cell wall-anchored protein